MLGPPETTAPTILNQTWSKLVFRTLGKKDSPLMLLSQFIKVLGNKIENASKSKLVGGVYSFV